MEEPFEKMEEAGVPKAAEPSTAAMPTKEAQEKVLPKLSPQEFKAYNSMAEHMDMFVRSFLPTTQSRLNTDY